MQEYSFSETLNILDKVETAESVAAFRFEGVDLWPLFRMLLLFRRTEVKVIAGDPNQLSASTRLKLRLMKMTEKVKFVSQGSEEAPVNKVWAFYDETYYDELPARRRYHKFLDPIVEKDPDRFLRISTKEISEPPDFIGTAKWKVAHIAHHDYFWMVERLRISNALGRHLKGFFTEEITEVVPFHRFLRSASYVMYYAELYSRLIEKYRPSAILLVCYYDEQKFGLIHAARRFGVPIVDIQHGSQGQNHIMYHHWNEHVVDGFSTLPSVFWCWSNYWSTRLKKSLDHLSTGFTVTSAGHFWFDKLSEITLPRMHYAKLSIPEGRPIALFAVQPANFEDTVRFLREAMDADPERFWMIRLHPRMVADLRRFLEELEGYEEQYDIVDATRMQLSEAVALVEVVVSFWSTVLLDALYMGKPAVVVHPNGEITFRDLIEQGCLPYAETPEDFVKTVAAIREGKVSVPADFKSPHQNPVELVDKLLASKKASI